MKKTPSRVAHNRPRTFFSVCTCPVAPKQKSCATKSPLMQDWLFRLGAQSCKRDQNFLSIWRGQVKASFCPFFNISIDKATWCIYWCLTRIVSKLLIDKWSPTKTFCRVFFINYPNSRWDDFFFFCQNWRPDFFKMKAQGQSVLSQCIYWDTR